MEHFQDLLIHIISINARQSTLFLIPFCFFLNLYCSMRNRQMQVWTIQIVSRQRRGTNTVIVRNSCQAKIDGSTRKLINEINFISRQPLIYAAGSLHTDDLHISNDDCPAKVDIERVGCCAFQFEWRIRGSFSISNGEYCYPGWISSIEFQSVIELLRQSYFLKRSVIPFLVNKIWPGISARDVKIRSRVWGSGIKRFFSLDEEFNLWESYCNIFI